MAQYHVVFVAHGSRSDRWVEAQQQWWKQVDSRLAKSIMESGERRVQSELTFLEIREPLFESRLKELNDQKDQTELLIFPFFLSRSGHAGEEIPEIIEETLTSRPHRLIQSQGWTDALARNVDRRLQEYGAASNCPVVISGYGASHHDHLWQEMVVEIQEKSKHSSIKEPWKWAPAGHFFDDYAEPLRVAFRELIAEGHRICAVLPLYLAVSSYQEKLIPETAAEFPELKVLTAEDSILPDSNIEDWAADQVLSFIQ